MAPRFKKNMYRTYDKAKGSDALICFPFSGLEQILYLFRDKLAEKVLKEYDLSKKELEYGPWPPVDMQICLFEKSCKNQIEDFYNKENPGILARMFKTKNFKNYEKEKKAISKLELFVLSTSHDHPCIEIYSLIHSEEELSKLIESISGELNIEMSKNINLPSMSEIIRSNRSF